MKAVAVTLVVLLVLFCFAVFLSLFPYFFPPRFMPYAGIFFLVFVLFRPGSSCLLSVPLRHVRCSSCSLSYLLASHFSELLPVFFCLMSFSALQQLSGPLRHVWCSCSLSDLLASHYSELPSAFFCLFISYLSYFSGLACFVVFSYQTR